MALSIRCLQNSILSKNALEGVVCRMFSSAKSKKGSKGAAGDGPKVSSLTKEVKSTTTVGANILKEASDPKVMADSEYPDWLWHLADKRPALSELRRKKIETLPYEDLKRFVKLDNRARIKENNSKKAEEEAAAEGKRKRDLEREAARQALLEMEKTVEINENARILHDLEMLRVVPTEKLPSSVAETNPECAVDGLGDFNFGGSNPLEQLGLFMRREDDDEGLAEVAAVPKDDKGLAEVSAVLKEDEGRDDVMENEES